MSRSNNASGRVVACWSGLALALLLFVIFPGTARADCTQVGANVACAPPGTGGFDAGTADGFNVTIQSGTTISDPTALLLNDNNTVVNNGTLNNAVSGVEANGNNTITNNGSITVDDFGAGIALTGSNNVIVNNGAIASGSVGYGIVVGFGGTGSMITNNGTVAGGQFGTGISIEDDGSTLVNNGTITADGGIGVEFCNCITGFQFTNNGTVRAINAGYSVFTGGLGVMVIDNNGTFDGAVAVDGGMLNNRGLITITDPNTPLGGQTIDVTSNGTFTNFSTGIVSLRADQAGLFDSIQVDNLVLNAPGGGGTLRIVPQAGLFGATTTYTGIVVANTPMAGTFNTIASTSPFLSASAVYNAGSIDVTLTRVAFNAVPNLNGNQKAVGAALQAGYSPSLTGPAATLYANIFSATSTDVLNQLSGEATSATQSSAFGAANLFQSALADQSAAWRTTGGFAGSGTILVASNQVAQTTMTDAGPAATFLTPVNPIRVWTMGYGNHQSLAGDAGTGATETNVSTGGGAVGLERQFSPDLLAGFALGGSGSSFSSPNANTSGSLKGVQAGVYATKSWGPYYATGSLAYGYSDNSTTRTIVGLGPTETAEGSYSSNQFSGRIEAGRRFMAEEYGVTPFAALEGSNLWQSGYTETSTQDNGSAGVMGLTYQAQQAGSLPTTLGVQLDTRIQSEDGKIWAPYLRLGWQHEFMPARDVNAALTAIPDNGFTAQGARAASDTAMIDLGVKVLVNRSLSLFANGSSQMAGDFLSYGGKAGIMWAF